MFASLFGVVLGSVSGLGVVVQDDQCRAASGTWYSEYDGLTIDSASRIDIDHVVPLKEAWRSGASQWSPPWCTYSRAWISVKATYRLTANPAEGEALSRMLDTCEACPHPAASPAGNPAR
ncbi:hypothetical protein [Streptomyces sanglieri]|uniref:hypothetical protein n=1 Tax=Streptomyces sanglieri TaxID=193460 RepID=UPI003525BF8F